MHRHGNVSISGIKEIKIMEEVTEKKITVDLTTEQVNYLQRLGADVDSKVFLIDRIFANHANDEDTAMFDSVPFKHYMSEYEKAHAEWEMAKSEFQKNYLDKKVKEIVGKDDVMYTWQIKDYLSLKCEVTIL